MKKRASVISMLIMWFACCLASAGGAQHVAPNQQMWAGYVTDTHCGTHCQVTSEMKPDLKCVRLCVKKGSKYGLWSGNKVYELNPQALAAQFAAQNVKVTGTMKNGIIHATFIVPVPLQKEAPAPKSD